MKKLIIVVLLLIAAVAAVWYLKSFGITHENIYATLKDESGQIQFVVDDRYQQLAQKLERIDKKLDQLLEIANRPLPDGMQRAE